MTVNPASAASERRVLPASGVSRVCSFGMGMSADYETAVMLGATHLRIGSALFDD